MMIVRSVLNNCWVDIKMSSFIEGWWVSALMRIQWMCAYTYTHSRVHSYDAVHHCPFCFNVYMNCNYVIFLFSAIGANGGGPVVVILFACVLLFALAFALVSVFALFFTTVFNGRMIFLMASLVWAFIHRCRKGSLEIKVMWISVWDKSKTVTVEMDC